MPTSVSFESSYQKLNQRQKIAVDTIDGPVLVIAGPGTGKTQILTLRIANILKNTDTEPSSILALTFTEAAAREMRQRLIRLIGKAGYQVRIGTFHSFCSDIINENPERFSRSRALQTVSDLERNQILQEILENNAFTILKPLNDPLYYLSYIVSSISDLKREGFSFGKYMDLVNQYKDHFNLEKANLKKTVLSEKEKLLAKNQELSEIYQKYQQKLWDTGRYDFDDMINWVVESFENDLDFSLQYQEKYQYILVDEYQDTNSAQNRLLFALTNFWGESANIFAVGDPNQSIFRFQGASQENVLQFQKKFPKFKKITLEENYRSTSIILESSANLIQALPLKNKNLIKNKKIKLCEFKNQLGEDHFLIKSIKRKLKTVSPENIAIVVKENKDIEHLAELLKKNNLSFRLQGGSNILNSPLIKQFIKLLSLIIKSPQNSDDLDLFTILNYPYLNLDHLAVLKYSRKSYENKSKLFDFLVENKDSIDKNISCFVEKIIEWNHQSVIESVPKFFQVIFQESGLLNYILNNNESLINLNRFVSLFNDASRQTLSFPNLTVRDYVNNLQVMMQTGVKISEETLSSSLNSITITTAHKSKGLEWQIVYVYKFAEGYWSNKSERQMIKLVPGIIESIEETDKEAEERRLFYVVLTRAKQQLYLLVSNEYQDSAKAIIPSIFIEDLPKRHIKKIKTTIPNSKLKELIAESLVSSSNHHFNNENKYLQDLIDNLKISPTSLNTFLVCGYKFKLENLYKIPKAKSPSLCFGTAVHFALENLFLSLKDGHLQSKEKFLKNFEIALRRETITPTDFQDRFKHGLEILSQYYDFYKEDFLPPLFTEKKFGSSTSSLIYFDEIPITGKADRIDLIDPYAKMVRFTDYKTGKIRTRGEIEGSTQNSDGGYKRQLVFYKLLADLDPTFPYQVTETVLDFIEPKSGVFKKELFIITEQDVAKLKEELSQTIMKIKNFEFEKTSDKKVCRNCDFFAHCFPND